MCPANRFVEARPTRTHCWLYFIRVLACATSSAQKRALWKGGQLRCDFVLFPLVMRRGWRERLRASWGSVSAKLDRASERLPRWL